MKRTPLLIVGAGIALAFVPTLGLPAFYDSLLYLILHWATSRSATAPSSAPGSTPAPR
jgi:hypothetical protein